MSTSNRLHGPGSSAVVRNLDESLLPDPNQPAKMTPADVPAISFEGPVCSGDDNSGQFSVILMDHDQTSVHVSVAGQPEDNHQNNRMQRSSVMIVERVFRALGLSAIGTRKQRVLFFLWSLWFLVRALFLVIQYTMSTSDSSKTFVCQLRSTILSSPKGTLNRPIQTAIFFFDFLAWVIIFSSSLGGSLHYFPRLSNHPDYLLLHSSLEKWLVFSSAIALFIITALYYLLPLFNLVGNVNCPATVIEKILNEGKYDSNCSSSLDPLMVALAFDRRPILGNSLSPLTYDILAQLSLILIAILTPMRIVTIVNCANRALRALTAAHFSPRRSTFDAEAFFSDFHIVNNLLVRIQRQLGFQVLLVAVFNALLTILCLVEIQLSSVLLCFQLPQNNFPDRLHVVKWGYNSLRIVCATYALACCLIPICVYNFSIEKLAEKVSALLQADSNYIMVTDIAFDWLKPTVVMTNTCSVSASVLDERRKKFRSTSEPQQRRLSNLLIALHHGDFSFSLGGALVLQFKHLVTFYSVVGSVYYFCYQAALVET